MIKKLIIIHFCLISYVFSAACSAQGYDPNYTVLRNQSILENKNFYLLTALNEKPEVLMILNHAPILKKIAASRLKDIKKNEECENTKCILDGYLWKKEEIDAVGIALGEMVLKEPAIKSLVRDHLRPSGRYQIYSNLSDDLFIKKAWENDIKGINHIIETYGFGNKPVYPNIDSVSYDVNSKLYNRLVRTVANYASESVTSESLYAKSLQVALGLLEINNRDEASRFEPMISGENKAANEYIKTIDFSKYKYSLILVPGAGNDLPNIPMSAFGKLRLKLAVDRYLAGLAPLIVVSGGFVHPFQTPYCEALEMKKYLMQKYGIAEKVIILEPHARHTTTNIRNTSRLIFSSGIPSNKPALITTTEDQRIYIEDSKFKDRCLNEMRCLPYNELSRISKYDLKFLPSLESMYYYAIDPLDP